MNPAESRLYRERSLVESLLRYRTLAGTAADDLTLLRQACAFASPELLPFTHASVAQLDRAPAF